jgi:hypothetical protein
MLVLVTYNISVKPGGGCINCPLLTNVELTTSLALKVGKSCAKVLKDENKK